MTSMFHFYRLDWVSKNVSADQDEIVQKWFMGQIEGMKGHKTRLVARNSLSKAPYRLHHLWTVEITE